MKQFAINGKYLTWGYCPAIIELDEEGNRRVYSYVAPVYTDPNGDSWEDPGNSWYDGDDESWRDEPAMWWLWLYDAEEPIEFTNEEEAKKEMVKEFLKTHTFVRACDNSVDFDWYETEEERLEREAEEAKKAKEAEERKQAFIDSWNENDRDFFKVQLRECGYSDTNEAVDKFRKRIEREYEDWYERNQWIKTWTNFLDGENIIGYIYGNL